MNNKEKEGVQFQSTATVWALTKPTYIRTYLYMNVVSSEKGGGEKVVLTIVCSSSNGHNNFITARREENVVLTRLCMVTSVASQLLIYRMCTQMQLMR